MKKNHPSDQDIQEYSLGNRSEHRVSHIETCDQCKAKALIYQQLFTALRTQPAAVFDFDLSTQVLSKIRKPKTKLLSVVLFAFLFSIAGILFSGCIVYLLNRNASVTAGWFSISTSLLFTTALIILMIYSSDLYRTHKRNMKELNLY